MESDTPLKPGLPVEAKVSEQAPAQPSSTNTDHVPYENTRKDAAQPARSSGAKPTEPQGYKIVEKLQPDGTMKKFRQPIVKGNINASTQKPKTSPAAGTAPGATNGSSTKYKIVLIPQADGTLKKFKRPIVEGNNSASTQQPKVTPVGGNATMAKQGPAAVPAATKSNQLQNTKPDEEPTSAAATKDSKADNADPMSLELALDEQRKNMRERKMRSFKGKLLSGFSMAIGSSIPAFEISTDHHDGDQEMSDDDDWSGEDDNADDHDDDDVHSHNDDAAENQSHEPSTTAALNGKAAASNLFGAMAAHAAQPPPRQPPPMPSEKADTNITDKRKAGFKLTTKEVDELHREAENLRPLKKHWANITFYILASLSIVLPLLFFVLAVVIFLMNGKRVDSSWGTLIQVIKVGVSAWPIIFAAVVAQVFKTFATYKVERGIKLMELEQLVGSSSFASAVKQPILLRRVDALSLVLFITWCVSPLGSSALQRTYTTTGSTLNTTTTAYYLNTTGLNRVFNRQQYTTVKDGSFPRGWSDAIQDISVLYTKIFSPQGVFSNPWEDEYNHPNIPWLDDIDSVDSPQFTSAYGIPMVLSDSIFGEPKSLAADPESAFQLEITNFVTRSSYFDFTCKSWSVANGSYFDIPTTNITYNYTIVYDYPCSEAPEAANIYPDDSNVTITDGISTYNCRGNITTNLTTNWISPASQTSHARFGYKDPTTSSTITVDSIEFASVIRGLPPQPTGVWPLSGDASTHSVIQCDFQQKFVELGVGCARTSQSSSGVADCLYDSDFRRIRQVDPVAGEDANLGDKLPGAFMQYTSPNDVEQNQPTTPNEIFLGLYGREAAYKANDFNLSAIVTPEVFAKRLSYLFNTFVNLGNVYQIDTSTSFINYTTKAEVFSYNNGTDFVPVPDAHWYRSGPSIFVVDLTWTIIFLVCVVMLLVAGIVSVTIESMTVAPDTLGYVSSVARNSKHLHLPKTKVNSAMSGGERAKVLGSTVVMMQDVKPDQNVGRIALGMKHKDAKKLEQGRLYR